MEYNTVIRKDEVLQFTRVYKVKQIYIRGE